MNDFELHIAELAGQTKVQQLVYSITEAISTGKLKVGDVLPSVNQLSLESGFSRDTVFKAYNILKRRSVVESAPTKGYYVANESFKVFMLLDDFSAFKEQLYQSFRADLPEAYSVDLLFHHYNHEVFRQLVQNSLGRYSMYVIMNIDHKSVDPILEKIDTNKLLIIDMGKPDNDKMNYLTQNFYESVISCLEQSADAIKKYEELVLIYEENNTPHPSETAKAIKKFCKKNQVKYIKNAHFEISELKKGQAYFVIRDADLVKIIKECRNRNLVLGKDVGVLSYNDTPMKEIVGSGISVISTDFEEMGKRAAAFVKNKLRTEIVLPTYVKLRDSL
ncbi:GntR family transcriptional regulator [Maribellus comscasis]|uniref:GntR family transcriptional regulator n=1 Tax=Maribellus comscasis TaxID=2681766 RepID=A0A6I6JGX2_9BACT|nr:GntR family transcriptional regulator [Maribellus comscasis]QGY42125.1 GntR family transcriptional regulator [Maribellus comscasis]